MTPHKITFIGLLTWLLINAVGVCLVGWLGVFFANAVFATSYAPSVGIAAAALLRLIVFIVK